MRAVAAEALLPMAEALVLQDPVLDRSVCQVLWDVLADVDELSACTGMLSTFTCICMLDICQATIIALIKSMHPPAISSQKDVILCMLSR